MPYYGLTCVLSCVPRSLFVFFWAVQSNLQNVVYFLADDMRADWGCYGLPAVTPNLDALAKDALLFEHAFCQVRLLPVCCTG